MYHGRKGWIPMTVEVSIYHAFPLTYFHLRRGLRDETVGPRRGQDGAAN